MCSTLPRRRLRRLPPRSGCQQPGTRRRRWQVGVPFRLPLSRPRKRRARAMVRYWLRAMRPPATCGQTRARLTTAARRKRRRRKERSARARDVTSQTRRRKGTKRRRSTKSRRRRRRRKKRGSATGRSRSCVCAFCVCTVIQYVYAYCGSRAEAKEISRRLFSSSLVCDSFRDRNFIWGRESISPRATPWPRTSVHRAAGLAAPSSRRPGARSTC